MKRTFAKYIKLLKALKPDGNHFSVSYSLYDGGNFAYQMSIHHKDIPGEYQLVVATGQNIEEVYYSIKQQIEEIFNGNPT
jgi:hypothetical protein